jgi:pimeloyl-ACP methyl ester carboxylesterase
MNWKAWATVVVLVFFFFFVFVRSSESSVAFKPSTAIFLDPLDVGLAFREVYFNSGFFYQLHGWLVQTPGAEKNILFCHGHSGNMSNYLPKIKMLSELGFNVFIFDYRGFGRSKGVPTEQGLYKDAEAAYDRLMGIDAVNEYPVLVYGEDIGAVAALRLADQRRVKALVLESAFTSARELARVYYPWVPSFFISLEFNAIDMVQGLRRPKLFIHDRKDPVVPFRLGRRLYETSPDIKDFLEADALDADDSQTRDERLRKGLKFFLQVNKI